MSTAMGESATSYYPPRAGRGRLLRGFLYRVARVFHLGDMALSVPGSPPRLVLNFLIPGFTFVDAGWKGIGLAVTAAWLIAGIAFVLLLGLTAANFAWAAMISIHVSSILYTFNRLSPGMALGRRLFYAMLTVLFVSQVVYWPARNWLQKHAFMPLRTENRVMVINCFSELNGLQRGELVACHTAGYDGRGQSRIKGGYFLNRALAGPGDTVQFSSTSYAVNGRAAARLRYMPGAGSVTIPQKTWLVWPNLDTIHRINISDEEISSGVLVLAMVPEEHIVGRPCRWWFFRRQTI